MKLVNYNSKHESIGDVLELGELTESQMLLIKKILKWMEPTYFSRYNTPIFCQSYNKYFDEEELEYEITFKGRIN
jgi:hypothetical protein